MRWLKKKLLALTEMVRAAHKPDLAFGFNEWLKAQDGEPRGQDWQTWSAALYLYAASCVAEKRTPFFDEVRKYSQRYHDVKEDQN